MSQPTRADMITAAVALLESGLLASALPPRLMSDYGLTPTQARDIAAAALKRWKAAKNES